MCKSDDCIRLYFCIRFEFHWFLLMYLRFRAEWENATITIIHWNVLVLCVKTKIAFYVFLCSIPFFLDFYCYIWDFGRIGKMTHGPDQPLRRPSVSSQPRRPVCQPESRVETGWKLDKKMRMIDPWPRPVPAASPGAQPASQNPGWKPGGNWAQKWEWATHGPDQCQQPAH